MKDESGRHVIVDEDNDRLLVGEPDEDTGERYIGVESEDGERQAVILTEEQQDELRDILGVSNNWEREQIVRAAIVQDLLERTVTAGPFAGKAVTPQTACAVLLLAAFIETGVDGVADLSSLAPSSK